ncbi:hypothetical protein EV421DRAFT_1911140 [Armillaria borealis]|uniref:Membrane-associated protein n=1 Tax=Armillaria borealis TaxID=47425 RepID=A0AA39IYV3_9AGAR|nr:hypothetical protein EV421DRAFT_1911140 [Armillaria borealis]
MDLLLQALTLVSVLAPNALEVSSGSPRNNIISVPTVSFSNGDAWTMGAMTNCTFTMTVAWERILSCSFQSDSLIEWNVPAGCGSACNYTIKYAAPALQCSDIGQDKILHNGYGSSCPSNPSAILQSTNSTIDTAVYNATTSTIIDSMWNFTMAWRTYHDSPENITVAGVQCSFYNSTHDIIWGCLNGSIPVAGLSTCASYMVIMGWLCNQLDGAIEFMSVGDQQWFSETKVLTSNLFLMNETAWTFSPNPSNMSCALEEVMMNMTVALMSSEREMMLVEASVAQDRLVWVYQYSRLWIPYGVTLVCMAMCGVAGLACMVKNKDVGDLGFSAIAKATRNKDLDNIFGGGTDEDVNEDALLQYGLQRKDGQGHFRVFELTM